MPTKTLFFYSLVLITHGFIGKHVCASETTERMDLCRYMLSIVDQKNISFLKYYNIQSGPKMCHYQIIKKLHRIKAYQ